MNVKIQRVLFGVMFCVLFFIEYYIARYVHDQIIRPYIGDLLVVIVIYCFIRMFIPRKYPFLPLAIFVFSALVEGSQALQLTEHIKALEHRIFRIILGATFDLKDIGCYFVGCVLIGIFEYIRWWEGIRHEEN